MNIYKWSIFCILVIPTLVIGAEEKNNATPPSNNTQQQEICITNKSEPNSQECADLMKRSQLDTTKLSPQIRSTQAKPIDVINNADLAPFIGGSGNVN